ncbi:MAG TPA: hypothetical protein VJU87_01240 [Gemmatimonadaceae bacterium]|nr:hypothetical protein [Gemmatimonadaceae bacterium]
MGPSLTRCAAALLVLLPPLGACDQAAPTAPSPPPPAARGDLIGSTVTYLTQQLLASEPLIPDGSLTTQEDLPYGNTIHVVTHDDQDSWKVQVSSGTVTFEEDQCDAAETPLPTGALHLVVVPGAGPYTYARLRSTRYHRTYLRDLSRLDYHACDQKNNGQQWPFLALEIDWNGDNTIDDEIVFEPAYQNAVQGGLCGLGSAQPDPVYDKWQFWDALRKDATNGDDRACWWSVEDPTFPPGDVIRPLSQYIAAHQDAAIVNLDGNHGGVQVMHGFASASDSFDGWVDALTIGKDVNGTNGQNNSTITYDFQQP